ncbi:MAG: hypothetical protein KDL87_16360 [Verrucomicrobiae bacterium]|nr:hypothetical protein [Verrucomicrobiae bacterium]
MLITFLAIFSSQAFGRQWTVHWEAAKGETECSIVYEPRTLDELRSKLPAGHPEANADIKKGAAPAKASTKTIGTFHGNRVLAIELEVPTSYYSRYFMIVAEVETEKFMPVYIHQYAQGSHCHGSPRYRESKTEFTVTITSRTIGTDPSEQTFRVTCDLKSPPKIERVDA